MTVVAFSSASSHSARSGSERSGSTCSRYSAVSSPAAAAAAMPAVSWPSAVGGEARAGGRQEPDLAQSAPVGGRRDLQQPGAEMVAGDDPAGDVQQRAGGVRATRAVREALAPHDDDVLAGVAQDVRDGADLVLGGARRLRELGEHATAAERGAQRCDERLAGARREARDGRGVGVERRRAAGRDDELDAVAAHALADAQVDDRHVVDGLAVEHEDGVGELEVGHRRLQRRAAQRGLQARPAGARTRARPGAGSPGPRAAGAAGGSPPRWRRRRRRARRRVPSSGPARPRRPPARAPSSPARAPRRRAASGWVMRSSTWIDW